jgi:hypothetical protein
MKGIRKSRKNWSALQLSLIILSVSLACPRYSAASDSVSYSGSAKSMEFYFHYLDKPATLAGLETKYTFNTTQAFRFTNQKTAYQNSFYKPIGLPKIGASFYMHPSLVAPVTVDGDWRVSIWVNSTAYKPVTFTLEFKEISQAGTVLWDSGQLSPGVKSSIGDHVDVPVFNYVLSVNLKHTFSADSTIQVTVEVNAGSSSEIRIWYDSPLYPSKIILPATDYARPIKVETFAYDGSSTDLFDYTLSQEKRVVTVRVNVTDPFGSYDVKKVSMEVLYNNSNIVSEVIEVLPETTKQILLHSRVYTAKWTYPLTAILGNYSVRVSVIDDNGYYQEVKMGSLEPFVEYYTHDFVIGPVVYFDPTFLVIDEVGDPVPHAQVYVTWPNGYRDITPRYADVNGSLTLLKVIPADYGFTVIWKDTLIKQTNVSVKSNGPYMIRTDVYELTVKAVGNDLKPVKGTYIIAYNQAGLGYGFAVTDDAGQVVLKLPGGNYSLQAHYSTVYYLTEVTTTIDATTYLQTSSGLTMTFADYPPPIWKTTAFVLGAAILAVVVITALIIVKRRR